MAVHQAQITLYKIVNVESTTRYYLLQSSTATAPARPTVNPPGGNWVTSEPAYTSGSTNTLYFVDLTVYSNILPDSNVNYSYSPVSKSSSYEAAKEAYNKATSAKDAADSANEKVDNMEIGGRNLLFNNNYSKPITNEWTESTITSYFFRSGSACIVEANQEYTFSIIVEKTDENEQRPIQLDIGIGNIGQFNADVYRPLIANIPNGIKVSATFEIPESKIAVYQYFAWRIRITDYEPGDSNMTIRYKEAKLEKGNVATDWTPAPEDSIATIDVEYYLSTSSTSLSDGSWSTTAPAWVDGKYMWSRTVTTDGAGNKTYTEPQCIGEDAGAINEKFDTVTDNIQTDLDNKDVNTFSALSIDGGKTLASYNLADYLESGTLTNGAEADSTTYIRSNEYIKVSEGEVYTWNVKNSSGTAVTPTTCFYSYNETTGAYTYLSSQSTNNITVPTNDNVYIRFTIAEIRSEDVDTICMLAINGIDDLLDDSSVAIYIGLYSTLGAYASIDPDDYEWRMADSTILANSQTLYDALNNKLYDETNGDIKKLTDAVDDAKKTADDANERIDNRNKYIQILPNEATIRLLADGNGINPSSEVKMTSDKISFSHDGVEGAYIGYPDAEQSDRTAMAATKTYVTEMYPRAEDPANDGKWVGSLCWVARTNGHLSLKVVK